MIGPRALRFVRPILHAWFWLSRGLTVGVRGAVMRYGQVLLIRHTYGAGWHLPGGGVERGETLVDALGRELREEAEIELVGDPTLHGIFFNDRVTRRDHVAIYVVRSFLDRGPKRPDREIAEAAFFPLDALPDGITAGTRERLREIALGLPAARLWHPAARIDGTPRDDD